MPVVCFTKECRALDEAAAKECQIPSIVLMESAGRVAADVCERWLKDQPTAGRPIIILCGPGSNGGDGYVLARTLAGRGYLPCVLYLGAESALKGDARLSFDMLRFSYPEVPLEEISKEQPRLKNWLAARFYSAGLIVDALFGSGLNRPLEEPVATIVNCLNELHSCPVVSLDIPSGLNGDSLQIQGAVVQADATVTFGFYKPALLLEPAASMAGEIFVKDIGIPTPLIKKHDIKGSYLSAAEAATLLPQRPRTAHKGTFGHALLVGGSPGKSGALVLCSLGALHSGVGLCTVSSTPEVLTSLPGLPPEAMSLPYSAEGREVIDILTKLSTTNSKVAVAFGPGWGDGQAQRHLLFTILHQSVVPVVLDADALNIIAQYPQVLPESRVNVVITPHPGEMSRLLRRRVEQITADPITTALDAAKKFGVVVVLKGAPTVIATPDGFWSLNVTGNNGLATGGSGDLLTGIITSFIAQGLAPFDAARLGCYLHGLAADIVVESSSFYSLLPSDVANNLSAAIRRLAV